jgi:hypothetical protein
MVRNPRVKKPVYCGDPVCWTYLSAWYYSNIVPVNIRRDNVFHWLKLTFFLLLALASNKPIYKQIGNFCRSHLEIAWI